MTSPTADLLDQLPEATPDDLESFAAARAHMVEWTAALDRRRGRPVGTTSPTTPALDYLEAELGSGDVERIRALSELVRDPAALLAAALARAAETD